MRYRFFLGILDFIEGEKRTVEVTEFIEFSKDIKVKETIDSNIKNIDEVRLVLPRDIPENANEFIGFEDIRSLVNNVNLEDRLPFYITEDDNLIFNGLVSEFSRNIMRGWGFSNRYIDITYKLDHKATELNEKFVSKKLNLTGVDMETHIKSLVVGSNKITKYRRRDVDNILNYENKVWEDNVWSDNVWEENSYYEPTYRSNSLIIDKNDTQNFKTIKIGDAFHRTYVDAGQVLSEKFSSIIVGIKDGISTNNDGSLEYYEVHGYEGNRFTDGEAYIIKITSIDNVSCSVQFFNSFGVLLAQNTNVQINENTTVDPIVGSSRWVDIRLNSSKTQELIVKPFFIEVELKDDFDIKWNSLDSFTEDMIGYEIVTGDGTLPIIYNPYVSMKKTLSYISDVTEKYFYSFKVDDNCNIKIFGNAIADSNAENTLYIDFADDDNNVIFSEFKEKGDTKSIISGTYAVGYVEDKRSQKQVSINTNNVAKNMFHFLDEELNKSVEQIKSSSATLKYIKMGVGGVQKLGFNMDIDEVDARFLQNISIPVSRNNLDATKYVYVEGIVGNKHIYQELIKGTGITNDLQLSPAFLNVVVGVENEIQMYIVDKQSSARVKGRDSDENTITIEGENSGSEIILASSSSSVRGTIVSSEENRTVIHVDRGEYDAFSNDELVDVYIVGLVGLTFLELSVSQSIAKAEWIELDGQRNYALSLNKTISMIDSYVYQMPVKQNLDTYDGKSEVLYLLPSDVSTDRYRIIDQYEDTNVGIEFVNNYPEFLNNYTSKYDIVYIQAYNEQSDLWETFRTEGLEDGTVILKDPVILNMEKYGTLVKFRRVFKTKVVELTQKPTDDNIYEAYLTSSRNSFGFNLDIDIDAIAYITNGNESKWKGKLYQFGSIIGADFNTSIKYNRYANDVTSFERYGYIEDKLDGEISSNEDFTFHSRNELLKRARSYKEIIMKARVDAYYKKYSIQIEDIEYISITDEEGNEELYQVVKKDKTLRKIDKDYNGYVDLKIERV